MKTVFSIIFMAFILIAANAQATSFTDYINGKETPECVKDNSCEGK